jgi:cell wall-associated NlpC family hydrolase
VSEYTYRQLESLWLSAGGRRSMAPVMAAIAEAESGGNPDAANPSGATGLWQILGAVKPADQSKLTSPNVNAREAVLKLNSQGLDAWTTYTSGAYKKFLQGGAPSNQQVGSGQAFVTEAEKFDGTPYVWGGDQPGGFDCSGLVQYALQKLGLKNVPRTSEQQYNWVAHIDRSQLQPGDLVFYAGSDGTDTSPGHVAIYQGNGKVIQAEETGTNVGSFPIDAAGQPVGYGRVPGLTGVTGGTTGSGNVQLTSIEGWPGEVAGFPGLAPLALIGDLPKLGNIGGPLGSLANAVNRLEHGVEFFFVPSNWMRIICFVVGVPLVGIGIVTMTKGTQPVPVSVGPVGTEISGGSIAPAVGIAEVVLGSCLLFAAFHNLQAQGVSDFPGLLSYFQGALQRQGAQATDGGA